MAAEATNGLIVGYTLTATNEFEVLTFGSLSGDFATYIGLDLPGSLSSEPEFRDGNLILTVVTSRLAPEPSSLGLCAWAAVVGVRTISRRVRSEGKSLICSKKIQRSQRISQRPR